MKIPNLKIRKNFKLSKQKSNELVADALAAFVRLKQLRDENKASQVQKKPPEQTTLKENEKEVLNGTLDKKK